MSNISVFPAHAGMIPEAAHRIAGIPRVPRACGDDPEAIINVLADHLCSPRMRG